MSQIEFQIVTFFASTGGGGSTLAASALGYSLAQVGSVPTAAREDGLSCCRWLQVFARCAVVGHNFLRHPSHLGCDADGSGSGSSFQVNKWGRGEGGENGRNAPTPKRKTFYVKTRAQSAPKKNFPQNLVMSREKVL